MSNQRKRSHREQEEEGTEPNRPQGSARDATPTSTPESVSTRSSTCKKARLNKGEEFQTDMSAGTEKSAQNNDVASSNDERVWVPCIRAPSFSINAQLDNYKLHDGVTFSKEEAGLLCLDALKEWGFSEAARSLQKELGHAGSDKIDSVREFRDVILDGNFDKAVEMLDDLPLAQEKFSYVKDIVTFLLLREKYIETLSGGNQEEAKKVLHEALGPLVNSHVEEVYREDTVGNDLDIISSTTWDEASTNELFNAAHIASLPNSTTPEADVPQTPSRATPESDPSEDVCPTSRSSSGEPSFVMRCLTFAFGRVWRRSQKPRHDPRQEPFDKKSASHTMMVEHSRGESAATFTRIASNRDEADTPLFHLNVPLRSLWTKKSLEDLSMLAVCGMSSAASKKGACCGAAASSEDYSQAKSTDKGHWKANLMNTAYWLSPERGSRKILWDWIAREVLDPNIIPPGRLNELIGQALDSQSIVAAKHGSCSKNLTLAHDLFDLPKGGQRVSKRPCSITLNGHDDEVWAVCCSADGKWIATGDAGGTIRVWNAEKSILALKNGETEHLEGSYVNIAAHEEAVTSLSWSASGNMLLSGSEDRTLRLWNMETLLLNADAGDAQNAQHVDSNAAEKVFGRHRSYITKVCWLNDGRHFLSSSEDGTLILWNRESHSAVCGEWKDIGVTDFSVAQYNAASSDPFSSLDHSKRPTDCIFVLLESSDLRILFADTKRAVDLHSKRCAIQYLREDDLQSSNDLIKSVISAGQEHALHAGQRVGSPAPSITSALEKHSHKKKSKERLNTKGTHIFGYYADELAPIDDASFSVDDRYVVGQCSSLMVDRRGRSALISAQHLPLRMWDMSVGKSVGQYFGHTQHRYVLHPAFCGNRDELIAVGSEDCCIYLWHRESSEYIHQLEGHTGVINSVSWTGHHEGGALISVSDDKTVRLWLLPEQA